MRKDEFIRELEYLLQDISDEDKEDAIAYYRDYLEEAGSEKEEEVIRDFGSPERIAAIIRSDLNGNLSDGGEFTENGYEDKRFRKPNFPLAKRLDLPENIDSAKKSKETENHFNDMGNDKGRKSPKEDSSPKKEENPFSYQYSVEGEYPKGKSTEDRNSGRARRKGRAKWEWWQILGMIFLVFFIVPVVVPLVFGLGGSAIGVLTVLAVFLLAVTIALAALTFAFFLFGIFLTVFSLTQMANPIQGCLALGTGIGFLGVGFLFLALSAVYYGKFLPWMARVLIDGISRLLHRKEVSV